MDFVYESAKSIINSANSNIDGAGLIGHVLRNVSSLHDLKQTKELVTKAKRHLVNTMSRGGYAGWIFTYVCWFICMIAACAYLWYKRCQSIKKTSSVSLTTNGSDPIISGKKPTKMRLESSRNKISALLLILLFNVLLLIFILLGLISTVELYVNVSTKPPVGPNFSLLSPESIDQLSSNKMLLFPRVTHGLSSLKSYLKDFLAETKIAINPATELLINATNGAQEENSQKFSKILDEHLLETKMLVYNSKGIFNKTLQVHENLLKIENQQKELRKSIGNLRDFVNTIHDNWLDYLNCTGQPEDCNSKRAKTFNSLKFYGDSFVEDRGVAVTFLLQNMNIEEIRSNGNKSERIKAEQMKKNKEAMMREIDIPKAVRDEALKTWEALDLKFQAVLPTLDAIAVNITRDYQPRVTKLAGILVGIFSVVWPLLLAFFVFLSWLLFRYFCTTVSINSKSRRNARSIACVCLILLCICLICSLVMLLVSGYLFTEGCRHFDQNRARVHPHRLALDDSINAFLDSIWPELEERMAQQARENNEPVKPLPRVRNLINGLASECKHNVGILHAFNASQSYDFAAAYDPTLTNRIVAAGRKVLNDTLTNMHLEMFVSKKDEANLEKAEALDKNFNLAQLKQYAIFTIANEPASLDMVEKFIVENSQPEMFKSSGHQILQEKVATFRQLKTITIEKIQELYRLEEHVNNLPKASKFVKEIQIAIENLRAKLENKPKFVADGLELFDKHVAAKAPMSAIAQMMKFGPDIMKSAGNCRRLYDLYDDLNMGVCHGVVGPLNGLWMFLAFCLFSGTFGLAFALVTLLHRIPPRPRSLDHALEENGDCKQNFLGSPNHTVSRA